MLVIYRSSDEILIGTSETEPQLIKEYFQEGGQESR